MRRSKFSLSNYKLLSCDMGRLIPINITEVLPGDTLQQATSALVRASPLLAPVMHPVQVRIHHWYVPMRLVWEDFEDFITGGPDGQDVSELPTVTLSYSAGSPPTGNNIIGGLPDYLGIPPAIDGLEVNAMPFRAYNLIFNEWYRDQDLTTERAISIESGADNTTEIGVVNCAWEKDYFTSARPWEQKGPSINIPLSGDAPVTGIGIHSGAGGTMATGNIQETVGDPKSYLFRPTNQNPGVSVRVTDSAGKTPEIYADLSGVTAININQLREALALQRYSEARARYGSRYVEYLRYLGVRSSDARLARPEYLGGGKNTIQFSEVLQTAEGSDPVGEMRGHGIAAVRSNRYRRFFEEHGYVISLMSVRPKTIYTQSLARIWNRRIKEDFWQRELQHIGQQEVLKKEVKADHADAEGIFGYQDRYDEYRRAESTVAGEFRTSMLDFWHFARTFGTDPALNNDFVTCTPTDRPFAVPSQDLLYVMANNSIQARRLVAQTGRSFIY